VIEAELQAVLNTLAGYISKIAEALGMAHMRRRGTL
jgi:hypothetical protein